MFEDEEPLTLSSHALAALAEFTAEKDELMAKFDRLQEEADVKGPLSMDMFGEDWNESQFWYSDETANVLAQHLLDGATADTVIGVVSAPSAFVALKNLLHGTEPSKQPRLVLLEHDDRFAVFTEFSFYDFQNPLRLPAELRGSIDRIICDPPFFSKDCQTKMALTVKWLLRDGKSSDHKVILNTGERMEELVGKLYKWMGLRTTDLELKHTRGLSNEYYCYANFETDDWKWRS